MRRLRTQRSCPGLVVVADSFQVGPLRDGDDADLAEFPEKMSESG